MLSILALTVRASRELASDHETASVGPVRYEIIEPSKKVDPKYVTTTILTNDGKVDIGFIVSKTKDSVTLLMAGGKQETILKAEGQRQQDL